MAPWTVLASDIDSLQFELSGGFQLAIKILIAVFLFGVALDSRPSDFRDVARRPWLVAVCLATQYAVIPALTLLMVSALGVHPSVALGLLFVACCPSGNLSNLLTHRARGNVSMSVSLTTASNALCVLLTPVTFAFWGSLNADVDALMRSVEIGFWDMAADVALLIGLPFAAGLLVARIWPRAAERARRPVDTGTLVVLLLLILGGLAGQAEVILLGLTAVVAAAVVQNLFSLLAGYGVGLACRLPPAGVRTMTFEIGIRNTALAMVLVLAYFGEIGGAALAVAFWGLWDSVTGVALAQWWRRHPVWDGAEPTATATSA
jgi:bile acid:Na+ symporter, BASS family